jgi:hypothetical protein
VHDSLLPCKRSGERRLTRSHLRVSVHKFWNFPHHTAGRRVACTAMRSNEHPHHQNDHLEDFDSALGDVNEGSRSATTSGSTQRQLKLTTTAMSRKSNTASSYDESIRRGVLNARIQSNDETIQSPEAFMNRVLNGSSFSVTTGCMDDMMENGRTTGTVLSPRAPNEDYYDDTFTFDGSTITSARDLTHKKSSPQHTVVDFNAPGAPTMNHQQPERHAKAAEFGSVMSKTASSSRTEKSQAAKICCGLGRLGLVLAMLALLAAAVATILFLLLGNEAPPATSSTGCCQGSFEQSWSGREICNAQGTCCVVCASSIILPNNPNTGPQDTLATTSKPTEANTQAPEETTPQAGTPQISAPPTEPPSQALTTAMPSGSPVIQSTTLQPTIAPTTQVLSPAPTASPTVAATTQLPTAAPSMGDNVVDTLPTEAPTNLEIGAEILAPNVKCCTDGRQSSDFVGRIRCEDQSDPTTCCRVCSL